MLVDLLHMDFTLVTVTLWSYFKLHLENRRLLECGVYFDLVLNGAALI